MIAIEHGIFFNFQGEIIRLPVNPETITVRTSKDNKTYKVLKLGEINVLGDTKLSEINFEVLLPGQIYPFVLTQNDFRKPDFYIQKFQEYMDSKEPVRLVITGKPMAINQLVSIEDIEYEKRAGEEQDIYMKLELKEYREYSLNTYVPAQKQAGQVQKVYVQDANTKIDTRPKITEYTVRAGDDFYRIAKKMTGDGTNAAAIARYNGMNVLDILSVGQVIRWK